MQGCLTKGTINNPRVGFTVALARSKDDLLEAQRLRYKVFVEELGAHLQVRKPGHDIDLYDAYCDHLIVREGNADRIVGTYRILSPEAAGRIGSYYSENVFYINRLHNLRNRTVEVGRFCIHPDYRNVVVSTMLWAGIAEYMVSNNYEYVMGCTSIGMTDGGQNAANLFVQMNATHMAPAEYRAFPQHGLPFDRLSNGQPPLIPALIKGYLHAGAWVCGEPAWDPDFNTADLLMLLPLSRMSPIDIRHILQSAGSASI